MLSKKALISLHHKHDINTKDSNRVMSCMCNADCIITIVFTNIIYDAENPATRLFLGSSCIHSLRFLFRCIKPKVSFPDCSSHKKFLPQKNRLPYSFGIFLSVGKLLHLDHIQLFKPVNINCHTKIQ